MHDAEYNRLMRDARVAAQDVGCDGIIFVAFWPDGRFRLGMSHADASPTHDLQHTIGDGLNKVLGLCAQPKEGGDAVHP